MVGDWRLGEQRLLEHWFGFAVGFGGGWWAVVNGRIHRCPMDGCTLAPTRNSRVYTAAHPNSRVYTAAHPKSVVYTCPTAQKVD